MKISENLREKVKIALGKSENWFKVFFSITLSYNNIIVVL